MQNTKALAKNKWRSILANFVDDSYLDGLHHPCPLCGGEDRFRFTNLEGDGSYFCNQCGAGSGVHLIAQYLKISHAEAWKKIEAVLPQATEVLPPDETNRSELVRAIWHGAQQVVVGDEVWQYLRNRGITEWGSNLYIKHFKDSTAMIGIFAQGNKRTGLHVTFLKDGKKIEGDAKKMFGLKQGGLPGSAIRLRSLDNSSRLIVAEGIETALSYAQLHNLTTLPLWAAGCAQFLEKMQIPSEVGEVIIAGDADASFTGQAAAYVLAKKLVREGKRVVVQFPSEIGKDWNDEIQKISNAKTA